MLSIARKKATPVAPRLFGPVHGAIGLPDDLVFSAFHAEEQHHTNAGRAVVFNVLCGMARISAQFQRIGFGQNAADFFRQQHGLTLRQFPVRR